MSQAVSNLSFSVLLGNGDSWHNKRRNITGVKAMARDTIHNLHHLQRAPKRHSHTPPMKRSPNTIPSPPMGPLDPFPTVRTVQQLVETMERVTEDPFSYTLAYGRGRMPWEIKEVGSEYKMRFDMPGLTRDDVKVLVEVEDETLVVKAHKGIGNGWREAEESKEEWPAKSYGRYNCRIALPENVKVEEIKAEVKDGVLYITIPKGYVGSHVLDINVQ